MTESEQSESNLIRVIALDAEVETMLSKALVKTRSGMQLKLNPNLRTQFFQKLEQAVAYCWREGYNRTALLCDPRIRRQLHRLIERQYPRLPVISYAEIAAGFKIDVLYTLTL